MDENQEPKKEGDMKEFGKVVDVLHKKQELPTLRTYQGDTAEYIRNQNLSSLDIAVKERAKREEEKVAPQPKAFPQETKVQKETRPSEEGEGQRSSAGKNIISVAIILLLLGGAGFAGYYAFTTFNKPAVVQVTPTTEIIPYNNLASINASKEALVDQIREAPLKSGINIYKLKTSEGLTLETPGQFIDFLGVRNNLPASLVRILGSKFALGTLSQNGTYYFLVLSITDYGTAFSSMLDWESNLQNDLSFLRVSNATSTSFVWKDLIVRNKDVRALANSRNEAQIAYTFLDKNTVLIVSDLKAIGDIASAYTSGSVAR